MARPRRIPGHAYVGVQRYFLTICTLDRAEYLTDPQVVSVIVDRFLQTAREKGMAIIVYCVMPDHVHLLVDGEDDSSEMEPFVSLAKQRAGYWFSQCHGKKLWQKGYYDHVLRAEEKTEDVVFYIIANPIRKKLVENVMDYPFWGSGIYTREELLASIGLRHH